MLQLNLDPKPGEEETEPVSALKRTVMRLREGNELFGMEVEDVSPWQRNTLLLVTYCIAGFTWSGAHGDWTEAKNLLLPLVKVLITRSL